MTMTPATPVGPASAPPYPPPPLRGTYRQWSSYSPIGRSAKRAAIGAILRDTLSVFGKGLLLYVAVFLLYGAAIFALTLGLTALVFGSPAGTVSPPSTPSINVSALYMFLVITLALAVLGVVMQSIITASLTYFAVHRYRGTPVSLRKAFEAGMARLPSVLGASLVQGLLLGAGLAVGLGLFLVGLATLNVSFFAVAGLFLLVFLPIAIYLTLALSLYAPAVMIEGKTAIASLKRSWELTRGRRATLFVVLSVLGILAGVVGAAIIVPLGLFRNAYISALGTIISTAITGSWTIIFAAVAYQLIVSEPASVEPMSWAMRLPNRAALLRLGRFILVVEGFALAVAAILGAIHAATTGSRFVDSFLLFVFLIFLLLLAIGLLSGPGVFLSRPKFAPLDAEGIGRWRQWLSVPQLGRDSEFFELLLYTGLAFLLLVIATGIGAILP